MNDRKGFSHAFEAEEFSVADALGGPRGAIESLAPTLVFLLGFAITREAVWPSAGALAVVGVLVAVRAFSKMPLTPALSGAVMVILGAAVAIRSGDGAGFYIPGLITNAVWAVVLIISIAVRHPLVGYAAAAVDQRVKGWKAHDHARKDYVKATAVYAALFVAKVGVQAPLYALGHTDALGIAKIVMGLPLFAAVTYVIYLMHRKVVARIDSEAVSEQ